MTSQTYLDNLVSFQWHNINTIPNDIRNDVETLIITNSFDDYSIQYSEIFEYLFMKVPLTRKKRILSILGEIERSIINIDWIHIRTKEDEYIITLSKAGNIVPAGNSKNDKIFTPGKSILDYFQWMYKYAETIKISYIKTLE